MANKINHRFKVDFPQLLYRFYFVETSCILWLYVDDVTTTKELLQLFFYSPGGLTRRARNGVHGDLIDNTDHYSLSPALPRLMDCIPSKGYYDYRAHIIYSKGSNQTQIEENAFSAIQGGYTVFKSFGNDSILIPDTFRLWSF